MSQSVHIMALGGLMGKVCYQMHAMIYPPPPVMRHQVPICQMSSYQEHLKKVNPLRELDECGGLRTQLFGNPYKLECSSDKVTEQVH